MNEGWGGGGAETSTYTTKWIEMIGKSKLCALMLTYIIFEGYASLNNSYGHFQSNSSHLCNCHLLAFLSFQVHSGPLQEAWVVASELGAICSNHITSSVILLGCGMLLRDASQIEHNISMQHRNTTSLPGMHRDRAEQADVSYKHLVNQSKG